MNRPADWDVYLVTDRKFSLGMTTVEIVKAAVRGGVSVVQLREKESSTLEFYREGLAVRDVLRASGVPLIINDRIDLALALDADGVHLGRDDMPLAAARRILGQDRIIGISVNDPDQITDEVESLADYVAVSPVFFTSTKQDITRPWGLEGLKKARAATGLPLVAIGSVKRENARSVVEAGADCVAVVTAIVSEEDPEQATREIVRLVREGKESRKRRSSCGRT